MAFSLYKGATKTMYFPKAASTAFTKGALVYFNGSGEVIPADATSGDHIGVIRQTIATTDSDYASETFVAIQVPVQRWVEWLVSVDGTATTEDIGLEIDLTDSLNANRAASSKDALLVTGFKSATELYVTILSNADLQNTATT